MGGCSHVCISGGDGGGGGGSLEVQISEISTSQISNWQTVSTGTNGRLGRQLQLGVFETLRFRSILIRQGAILFNSHSSRIEESITLLSVFTQESFDLTLLAEFPLNLNKICPGEDTQFAYSHKLKF